MEVICIETQAFDELLRQVLSKIIKDQEDPVIWISETDAMHLLGITSKTTLQKLRDKDLIRFTHPLKKVILYDKNSILQYLNKNANY